ncbi:MAG TPA: flagellar hook capping FlgD N-terminal domain-containing protein, partial [Alphaproteobacteria bacterium]
MTSDVSLSGSITDAQKTQGSGFKLAQDFSQFLTLLTTQLQNQDPLNPMDSSEFTNQLVQFSQVEQAINTNQKLDNILNLQLANISTVGLGYVGMDVMYRSADMNYDGDTPVTINYALAKDAFSAKMSVYDEEGDLVFTASAPKTVGKNEYVWDGKNSQGVEVEPGTYTVKIDAVDPEGEAIETSTVVSGRVRGIESQDGIVYLLIGER